MMVNFNASRTEYQVAMKIAKRAIEDYGDCFDYQQLEMDIIACHLNGCPLDLLALLSARPLAFAHDVAGIRSNIDRETGKLLNLFHPRHAVPEGKEVAILGT